MEQVKNALGKLVCEADPDDKRIEILSKGIKTLIRFNPDGTMEVADLSEPEIITYSRQ